MGLQRKPFKCEYSTLGKIIFALVNAHVARRNVL